MTGRVRGVGGIFLRSQRPEALASWYQRHLGFDLEADGAVTVFPWQEAGARAPGSTTWAILEPDSRLLREANADAVVNYCVENLIALVERLRQEGVSIEMEPQTNPHGCFAWIRDLENRRVELWEPPAEEPSAPSPGV
ncbi:MAG: VOC family protein [Chloroflexi bacterium]|nr:VOC family protein [Chloroflexota bacterium]